MNGLWLLGIAILSFPFASAEKVASYAGSTFINDNTNILSIDTTCGINFGIGFQSFPLVVNEPAGYAYYSIRGLLHSIDVHAYEPSTWKIMLYRNPFNSENLVAVARPFSTFIDELLKLSNAEYTIVVVTAPDPIEATFFAFDVHKSDRSGRLDSSSSFWFPPVNSICNSTSTFAPYTVVEFVAQQEAIHQLVAFIETPGVNNGMLALFPGHFRGHNPCSFSEPLQVMQSTDEKILMEVKLRKGFYYTLVLSVLPPLHSVDYSIFVREIPARDIQMATYPIVPPIVTEKWCTYECEEGTEELPNFGKVTFVAEGETYLMAPISFTNQGVNFDSTGFSMILYKGNPSLSDGMCSGFLVGTTLKETTFVFAPLEKGRNYTVILSKPNFPEENREYSLMMLTGKQLGHNETIMSKNFAEGSMCPDCPEKNSSEEGSSWLTISLSIGGVVVVSAGSVVGLMAFLVMRKHSAELPYIRRDSSAVMPPGFFIVPRSGSASTVHPFNLLSNSHSFTQKS